MTTARMRARAHGLKTYIGAPCKREHLSGERYASTGFCLECMRERYRSDPESVIERSAKRCVENREALRAYHTEYSIKNREKACERAAAYYYANTKKVREYVAAWRKDNQGYVRAVHAKRR